MAKIPANLLQLLAGDWGRTMTAVVNVSLAAAMLKMEVTSLTLRMDQFVEIMNDYEIHRKYLIVNDVPVMNITIVKREEENAADKRSD